MRAVFNHISGLKRGQREVVGETQISAGRAPTSTLAFAPTDTRASAHHAEITYDGTGYVLRDAGSTNGTYVNGRRVYTTRLKPGDIIEFGTGGPQVQFETDGESDASLAVMPTVAPTQALDSVGRTSGSVPVAAQKEFGRTTVRLMIDRAVKKSSTQFRLLVATLTILVVALMSVVAYLAFRPQTSAALDPSGIARQNQGAVVFIHVRFTLTDESGNPIEEERVTGSGFVVSPRGYIVTNRHVMQMWEYDPTWVRNHYGGKINEIRIVFADHSPDEAHAGRLVRLSSSTDVDLAILQIDPFDGMPALSNFNANVASLNQGDPVVVIGYPLGTDLFQFTNAKTAQTSLSAGVISKVSPTKIQIDAAANQGNSGGPIFDAHGRVIGVLTQGLASFNAQNINFGTPIDAALALLPNQ